MSINVVLAKAHLQQLKDEGLKKEYESIKELYKDVPLNYKENTINFVFVKGIYDHFERKMLVVCLFVNKIDKPIKEISGQINMEFSNKNAQIANITFYFDEEFLGTLNKDDALLVHFQVPVKGLKENTEIFSRDLKGTLDDVHVTFLEKDN